MLYISVLIFLTCISVREIRQIILEVLELLIRPILYLTSCKKKSKENINEQNPIEFYNIHNLTERLV